MKKVLTEEKNSLSILSQHTAVSFMQLGLVTIFSRFQVAGIGTCKYIYGWDLYVNLARLLVNH